MRKSVSSSTLFLATLVLLSAAAPVAHATSYGQLNFNQLTNALGQLVCREVEVSSSAPYSSGALTDCPGACPWEQLQKNSMFFVTVANVSGYLVYGGAAQVTCQSVLTTTGTCVQATEEDGCLFLGVSPSWSAYDQNKTAVMACKGTADGKCTFYTDNNCSILAPSSQAPVSGGGSNCTAISPITPASWTGWCLAAYNELQFNTTSCAPPPKPQQTTTKPASASHVGSGLGFASLAVLLSILII